MARNARSPRHRAVVVVTGASSGIGRATALALARRGAALVVTARRAAALDELARLCGRAGAACIAVPGDVSEFDHVQEVARSAMARFGRIDAWVNNAGVLMFGRIDQCPPESYKRVVDVNLLSYMHGAHCALGIFREQRHGVLVNVSSLLGAFSARYAPAYVASKHALEGLAGSLRQETNDLPDVYVCNVLPAAIDTPILEHAANYLGRAVKPLGFPLAAADAVASAVVRCIDRPRRSVVVGRFGKVQQATRAVAPTTHDRLVAWSTGRALRLADEVPSTNGNLFHPVERGTSTAGGWKELRRRRRRAGAVVVGAAAAITALRRGGR